MEIQNKNIIMSVAVEIVRYQIFYHDHKSIDSLLLNFVFWSNIVPAKLKLYRFNAV